MRLGVVNTVALAYTAFTAVCAKASTAGELERLRTDAQRLRAETELLRIELRLLHARFKRLNPKNRPHSKREERLEALMLRAARGWTLEQPARRLLLAEQTVTAWTQCLTDRGADRSSAPAVR